MALPKEPRQKMINIMYLVLTAILALNVSNEVINAFKVVNNSLETSNRNITLSNNGIYSSLEAARNKPETAQKAALWEPRAVRAKELSDAMNTYLDSLKTALLKAADYKMVWNGKDSVADYRADNLDASTRLFETKGLGPILKERLDQYRKDMLSINDSIKTEFEESLPINTKPPKTQEGKQKDFTQTFFHMTPTVAALTILSKFQNNVKNSENMVVTYCQNQIGAVKLHMDKSAVLVGQSSDYLMPGQQLTITAGVGAYSSAANAEVSFNGAPSEKTVDGQATYTTTVSGAGEHTVTINVTYRDENNNIKTEPRTIKYTVGTPGAAAVMLDKMNVFYIGVPNPVTINSGTGWDKTHVGISSGSITPSGAGPGKFNVNVKEVGKTTITVTANGKNSTYDFRVKEIPDPVFKVGPSKGGRIQSVVFKNQQFCRADLENFEFDAHFNVVSATVYFSGANFPTVQQATINGPGLASIQSQLAKCIPGTSVTFDNVKVKGPDGKERTIQGPGFILY